MKYGTKIKSLIFNEFNGATFKGVLELPLIEMFLKSTL
jgi:hypothetical protein